MLRFSRKLSVLNLSISAVSLLLLGVMVDWRQSFSILQYHSAPVFLGPFVVAAFAIVVSYAYRWRLLLGKRLPLKRALLASMLSFGGNMLLPARGGDLLRVHYSHVVADISHAEVLSRLFTEKLIELATIVLVGALSIPILVECGSLGDATSLKPLMYWGAGAVFLVMLVFKCFHCELLKLLRNIFERAGKVAWFERHIAHIVRDLNATLIFPSLALPAIITLGVWLTLYAVAYMVIARFVGIGLSYPESLLVLLAGALGLMIPAAPSGAGTFHASVVSAFILLGKPATEGLLLGTVFHLLFFVLYAPLAAYLYLHWQVMRRSQIQ